MPKDNLVERLKRRHTNKQGICGYCGWKFPCDGKLSADEIERLREIEADARIRLDDRQERLIELEATNRALREKIGECIDKLDMRVTDESFVEALRSIEEAGD
jgi:hypothetical protein